MEDEEDFLDADLEGFSGKPLEYPLNWKVFAANLCGLLCSTFNAIGLFWSNCQDDFLASHRWTKHKREFHERAAREIETITEG